MVPSLEDKPTAEKHHARIIVESDEFAAAADGLTSRMLQRTVRWWYTGSGVIPERERGTGTTAGALRRHLNRTRVGIEDAIALKHRHQSLEVPPRDKKHEPPKRLRHRGASVG